jgi:SAM-dependent methyltransferase
MTAADDPSPALAYERIFVPALFRQWAPRVAEAAGVGAGQRVLDVACGTGVLAREAVTRVGATGRVFGLDLSPGMLAVARSVAPEVELHAGSADALPWPDGSFDAVVSQFGLMFFPDRERALREMVRVLVPGGRLAVAVWGALADSPAFATEVEVIERLGGPHAAAAGAAMRAPFALGDPAALRALFERAGVAAPAVSTVAGTATFPSIRTLIEADLRGWLPLVGIDLPEDAIARILAACETELARYVTPAGTVEFAAPALIATGHR